MNARRVRCFDLVAGATLMAALAGCANTQTPPSAAPPISAQAPMGAQASAGAQTQSSDYGAQLTPEHYSELVAGNTLFRPLQSGGTTLIYIAPDQSLKLRIQTQDGRVLSDIGRETLEPGKVCWQWTHAGTDCFAYYWSGRLMTFVPTEGSILPAQFLVQKGNPTGL